MSALYLLVVTAVTLSLHDNINVAGIGSSAPSSISRIGNIILMDLGINKTNDLCREYDRINNTNGISDDFTKTYDVTKFGENHLITRMEAIQDIISKPIPDVQVSTVAGDIGAPTASLRIRIPYDGESIVRITLCSREFKRNECRGCHDRQL